MNIYLGNLSVDQIQQRLGIKFSDELVHFMSDSRQEEVNNKLIQSGKWHCFDIPFMIVCGDLQTAQTIHDHLKDQSSDMKEMIQISVSQS